MAAAAEILYLCWFAQQEKIDFDANIKKGTQNCEYMDELINSWSWV